MKIYSTFLISDKVNFFSKNEIFIEKGNYCFKHNDFNKHILTIAKMTKLATTLSAAILKCTALKTYKNYKEIVNDIINNYKSSNSLYIALYNDSHNCYAHIATYPFQNKQYIQDIDLEKLYKEFINYS